jgi:hypothetical protein
MGKSSQAFGTTNHFVCVFYNRNQWVECGHGTLLPLIDSIN